MLLYCDTSALAKLVLAEAESSALLDELSGADVVTSALARTELRRAVGRAGLAGLEERLELVVANVSQLPLDDEVLDRAASLSPPSMRSLDALHVASVLGLGQLLDGLVTYDVRMSAAAAEHGVRVLSPGA